MRHGRSRRRAREHARRGSAGLLGVALVAGLLGAVAVGSAAPAVAGSGVTVAGGSGAGSGAAQLSQPDGVAMGSDGSIYVTDLGNHRIQKFPPDATAGTAGVTVAGGNGNGSAANQTAFPNAVAVDADGNVFVTEGNNNRVMKWVPGATAGVAVAGGNGGGSAADQLSAPHGVAVDGSRNVFVADTLNHRVMKWAPGAASGVVVAGGNGGGVAANQLNRPWGLALDGSGNLYVADLFNYRIQRFPAGSTSTTNGVTVAGGNGSGSGADQFSSPRGIAVDSAANVYIADTYNHRIQSWASGSTSGETVAGGNGYGNAANQLANPADVEVDAAGRIFIADDNNSRIQRWSTSSPTAPGAPSVTSVTRGNGQVSVAFDPPADNGGATISLYSVACASSDGGTSGSGSGASSPVTVSGLTNGKTYTCTVTATNSVGTGSASSASSSFVPATVPGTPSITAVTPSDGQLAVAFAPPADDGGSTVIAYAVSCTSSDGGAAGARAVGATSDAAIAGTIEVFDLTAGKTYTCAIRAENGAGWGSWSSVSNAVVATAVAGVPGTPSGTSGDGQVALTWSAPTGGGTVTDYQVSVYDAAGNAAVGVTGSATRAVGSAVTSYTFTGLTNGTAYTFRVAAVNPGGTGVQSVLSGVTTPIGPADPPGAPTVIAGNGRVHLSWSLPPATGGSAITNYEVTVYGSAGGAPTGVTGAQTRAVGAVSTASRTFTFLGLTNGTLYTFRVAAVTAAGTGTPSVPSVTVRPVTVPGPTGVPTGSPGNGSVSLTWTPASDSGGTGVTYYRISVFGPSGGAPVGVSGATTRTRSSLTPSFGFSGLTNGTAYTFRVVAVNAVGDGAPSGLSAAITPRTIATAPGVPAAVAAGGQVALTWTPPTANGGFSVTDYRVSVFSAAGGTATGVTGLVTRPVGSPTTSLTFSGLTNGTAYAFKVAAVTASGTGAASALSAAVVPNVTPPARPSAPAAPVVTYGNGQVAVSWTAPTSPVGAPVTAYQVSVFNSVGGAPAGVTGTTSRLVTAASTALTFTGLTNGTVYTFRVAAANSSGTGTASSLSAAVTPRTVADAPLNVVAAPALPLDGKERLLVSFGVPVSDGGSAVTGYEAQCSANGGTSWLPATPALASSSPVSVSGLTLSVAYICRVRAANAVGPSSWSSPSAGVTVGAPVMPATPTVTALSTITGTGSVRVAVATPFGTGVAVTGYSVNCVANSDVRNATGTTSPITVTGLITGTNGSPVYACRVRAQNARGLSVFSPWSVGVVVGTPLEPTGVGATAAGTGSVTVTIATPGSENGSRTLFWVVRCESANGGVVGVVEQANPTLLTVTGLTSGKTYQCRAAARNIRGLGVWSAPSALVFVG